MRWSSLWHLYNTRPHLRPTCYIPHPSQTSWFSYSYQDYSQCSDLPCSICITQDHTSALRATYLTHLKLLDLVTPKDAPNLHLLIIPAVRTVRSVSGQDDAPRDRPHENVQSERRCASRSTISSNSTYMCCITTGIRSEQCVVTRFPRCANVYLHKPRYR
jgi:hypothetical protein